MSGMKLVQKLSRYEPTVSMLAGAAGLASLGVLAVTDGLAAAFDPGYDALRQPVSMLALGPMGWLQTLGFSLGGTLAMIFVVGLWQRVSEGGAVDIALGTLLLAGFELTLLAAFHTSPTHPWALHSAIHNVDAVVLLGSFPLASLLLGYGLWCKWRSAAIYAFVTGVIGVGVGAARLIPPPQDGYLGLYERVLVGNAAIWVAAMGLALIRSAPDAAPRATKS